MKILVVNAGSSSLKFQLIDMDKETLLCKGLCEKIGSQDSSITYKTDKVVKTIEGHLATHKEAMEKTLALVTDKEVGVIKSLSEISAFGHRVLHGAEKYHSAALVNKEVIKDIEDNIPLGPLHMPANLLGIQACMKVMPNTKNVAVFDTAFHATMPDYAYMYATPYEWFENYRVRKYGFHGTSHEFIMNQTAEIMGKDAKDLRIISCHLGNGASIAAIDHGKCIETSMGFTPLEGLVMGTRCGNIDPAVMEYVMNKENMSITDMLNTLNKKSGLLGISGISNDMRDIIKNMNLGNERCKLAFKKFNYEVKKYIGSYAAVMNGVDAIIFTAGSGENRNDVREDIMKGMDYLGIDFDFEANNNFERGKVWKLSKESSKVAVYIIPTDEELSIARQTKIIITSQK